MPITFLTLIYLTCAIFITLYTAGQLVLLVLYIWHRPRPTPLPTVEHWPVVLVQLPLYNERHVARRLLDSVAALEYPPDKLIIQLLDDSTDDTSALVANRVRHWQRQGMDVRHVRRGDRIGYKAGALDYGLSLVEADLVALFDADFVPPKAFLRQTVPHFCADEKLGIVQTRWGHLNADANWLTLAQTLSVDAHFLIEQTARNRAGLLLTFNGTGGLWRPECIAAAGGWTDDTLTEDLDLSYRAQLAGWRYLFLPEVVVPGELPPQLEAYKQQQARWAQGNTQCLLRLFRPVWRGQLTLSQRLMAMQHLMQYLPHPVMLLMFILTPLLMGLDALDRLPLAPLGLVGLAPPLLIAVAQHNLYSDWKRRLLAFPVLMAMGTGISWNNTRAVLRAFSGQKGEFRRTPKFMGDWQFSGYALRADWTLLIEALLAVYALCGVFLALDRSPALLPYFILYTLAFGGFASRSLFDRLRLKWAALQRARHLSRKTTPYPTRPARR